MQHSTSSAVVLKATIQSITVCPTAKFSNPDFTIYILSSLCKAYLPHTSLCVISNNFLATNQHKVLSIVEKFVGLDPFDWSSLEVSTDAEKITKSQHLGETADELPVSPSILKRLRDVFHEQPHVYYDHVKEWGFYGCRPNIAKTN